MLGKRQGEEAEKENKSKYDCQTARYNRGKTPVCTSEKDTFTLTFDAANTFLLPSHISIEKHTVIYCNAEEITCMLHIISYNY